MPLEKKTLLEFLRRVDDELDTNINLVAVGGTAMTLLGIKHSTIDIDFTLKPGDEKAFRKALSRIPHGYRIDIFPDGLVFSQKLPDDYIKKCILAKQFKHIKLLALHPLDIVVSKIGRLNERDIEDIKDCIRKFSLTRAQIKKRADMVEYIGKEENYRINLKYVLSRLAK